MGMTMADHARMDGELAALRRTAVKLLEAKFQPLSMPVRERLYGLSIEQLDLLLASLLNARSLKDLGLEE
jgi:hypothetical protein